jgi:hypothetical protein
MQWSKGPGRKAYQLSKIRILYSLKIARYNYLLKQNHIPEEHSPHHLVTSVALMVFTHLIKISDDLVKQPETLNTLIIAVQFHVEFMVVGDGCKHNANTFVALMVEVLRQSALCCAHAEGRNCAHTRR